MTGQNPAMETRVGAKLTLNVSLWSAIVLLAVFATTGLAGSPTICKVLDLELQGSYEGGCRKGLANGKGVARGIATYEGEFGQGMKAGRGVKVWPSGDRYDGEFTNDRKDGHGVYTWGEGTEWAGQRYEGEFKDDRRDGWGVYSWPNGDRYEGPWKQDQRMGLSVMETLQKQARAAQQEAFKPGVTVCWLNSAIAQGLVVKGKVESFDGTVLRVLVLELPSGLRVAEGTSPWVGQVIADAPVDWTPCT
jgi:hypothetical protein